MSTAETANRRILIVDDNLDIHGDFRKLLGSDGRNDDLDAMAAMLFDDTPKAQKSAPEFELSFASQGAEGLEMVSRATAAGTPYAVVFMDMRMPPGWDGLETLEKVWAVDPLVQAVICTAYSDYSWEQITERLGPTDRMLVLKKPFDALEVRQLALALTEKWNDRDERERKDALFRGLLRVLPDTVFLVRQDGVVVQSQIPQGNPPLQGEGSHLLAELLPEDAQQAASAHLRRVISTGAGQKLEYRSGENGTSQRYEARMERVDSMHAIVLIRSLG